MPISIDDSNGNIIAGGGGSDGDLVLRANNGSDRMHLDAGGGNMWVGGNGADGDAVLFGGGGNNETLAQATIHLDGGGGNAFLGGNNTDGDVVLRANNGQNRMRLDAGGGNMWVGGNGADGDAVLFPAGGDNQSVAQATIHLDGGGGNAFLGGNGTDGDLVLRAENGQNRMRFDAGGGNMWIGGNGADGDAVFFAASGDNQTLADATIRINGENGDLIIGNADCAEDFDIAQAAGVEPGMALVLGADGLLYPCDSPYDKRVVGIAAGAGNFRPGIILGRQHGVEGRMPVALIGRVQCMAEASDAPITVGDLLTTSSRPGHVMRVEDPRKAFGAVIGKALTGLDSGKGMVEVVVALQ